MSVPARHLTSSSKGAVDGPAHVTPEGAGWTYCGLHVVDVAPGGSRALASGVDEVALVPMAGSFSVHVARGPEELVYVLHGRRDPFEGVTDFVYLPPGSRYRVESSDGGRLAVASARAAAGRDPAYGRAEDVPVEIRGAGRATREVHNFMAPGAFGAEKLMAVEVVTPSGNWSSYPPHKHDEARPGEAELEEIYYFELRSSPEAGPGGEPFGLQSVYEDGGAELCVRVRSGDVVLVPRGYHGPSAAAPGYDMYYLNVLAGPGSERSMAFHDDPHHSWVRASWDSEDPDPRIPLRPRQAPLPGVPASRPRATTRPGDP